MVRMELNNISSRVGEYGALPSAAMNLHVLLVDHETTSLISLASRFRKHFYRVTSTESANFALSLLRGNNCYDVVIADREMPEMDMYKFVDAVYSQCVNILVIFMDKNLTRDFGEALANGVSLVFPKPPSDRDIVTLWYHIHRVRAEMPPAADSSYIDIEKYGNPSSGSHSNGAGRNKKQSDLKRNIITIDGEILKRRKNQIAEDSNSLNDTDEDDRCNTKKSRITWTNSLHQIFLRAIENLGEHAAQPKTLLKSMNVPGLTLRHVSSHLQKYRDKKRHFFNKQNTASPVMPAVLPASPMGNYLQGETSGTANISYMAAHRVPEIPGSPSWQKPPSSLGYSLDVVKGKLDALIYSGNNTVDAITTDKGVQISEGSGAVQIADQNQSTPVIPCANVGKQTRVFLQSSSNGTMEGGHKTMASGYLTNGLKALNYQPAGAMVDMIPISSGLPINGSLVPSQEAAGATSDVILASGYLSNGLQAANQEAAGATSDAILASSYYINGWQDMSKESADGFGIGMSGNLENVGNPVNDEEGN